MAASMAAVLLSAGAKGKRFCLPHSKVMIHQPAAVPRVRQTEIEIVAEEIKKTRRELNQILSDASGQPIEKVQADTERDNYLTAAAGPRLRPDRPYRLPRAISPRRTPRMAGNMQDNFDENGNPIRCSFCGKSRARSVAS